MPYTPSQSKSLHGRHDLVTRLVDELKNPRPAGTLQAPDIREDAQRFSGRLHVYVIWDSWQDVPDSNRGEIILDAYEACFGQDRARLISVAMGITPTEAKNMGIA